MPSSLSPAQKAALKADVIAAADAAMQALEADPTNADKAFAVKDLYNLTASPDYYVWDGKVPVLNVLNLVTWANYTPNDGPDNTNTWNNRAFSVQIKQANLSLLFMGRTTFDATKTNLRAALNDATTNLLTGAAGASRSGGWSAILPVLSRRATRAEKLLATDDGAGIGNTTGDPRGNNTNPDSPPQNEPLTLSLDDVLEAMAS